MQKVSIGFLGCGFVGGGAYDIIQQNKKEIAERESIELNVKKVLVRDVNKTRSTMCPKELLTDDFFSIVNDPEIQIVAEFIGGIEPARTYILASLNAGKTVVTANKMVLSNCWRELEDAARANKVGLYYDASVAGGIPVVKALYNSLQANRIDSIVGIINGTTNYILTKITEDGVSYEDALKEAQKLGLAEADPTMDVGGFDVSFKLSILASTAFNKRVPVEDIYCQGIEKISMEDIRYGAKMGLVLKLLAIGKRVGDSFEARVHPTFISSTHPLANVRGEFNAVLVDGNAVGEIMLYGKGAGGMPTGSSVVSDIINAAKSTTYQYNAFNSGDYNDKADVIKDWISSYYIRCTVSDEPGVLAAIAGIMCKYNVSIASCIQYTPQKKETPIVFLTHKVNYSAMQSAIDEIKNLDVVSSIDNIIPVEGNVIEEV